MKNFIAAVWLFIAFVMGGTVGGLWAARNTGKIYSASLAAKQAMFDSESEEVKRSLYEYNSCVTEKAKMEAVANADASIDTLLLESSPAAAPQNQVIQYILDLLAHDRIGTAMADLISLTHPSAQPRPTNEQRLAWRIPGRVEPQAIHAPSGAQYIYVDKSTGTVQEPFIPERTFITAALAGEIRHSQAHAAAQ